MIQLMNVNLQVHEKLGLFFKNTTKLNKIIDSLPGPHPAFIHHEVEVTGKHFDLFAQDIKCIQALFSDLEHVQYLCLVPECHYSDADKVERIYHEMHTGKWWWSTQVSRWFEGYVGVHVHHMAGRA